MNWISDVVRPRIKTLFKRETPENLWVKCPDTGQMVFHKEVEANLWVIPGSNHHLRINAADRLKITFDGKFEDIPLRGVAADPLKFRDEKRYADRLRDARSKTGMQDAVKVAVGAVDGTMMTVAVQDFAFMGGSLGMAAGEAIVTAADTARERRTPFVLFVASGGARMQEGILSLMQMPRTTVALRRLREARLPYIVVLTNPTTGGVTASYAMLGDVHIAEPGALIGFAGPRVIEQTIREKLPEGFQRAEYLKDHGMVDMVVQRTELKATIANLARIFMKEPAPERSMPEADAPVTGDREGKTAMPGTVGTQTSRAAGKTGTISGNAAGSESSSKSGDGRAGDGKPGYTKPVDGKSDQDKAGDGKGDGKSGDGKPGERKAADPGSIRASSDVPGKHTGEGGAANTSQAFAAKPDAHAGKASAKPDPKQS